MTTFASTLWLIVAAILTIIVLVRPGAATIALAAVFAFLQARRKRYASALKWPRHGARRVGFAFLLAGLCLELLAWLSSYLTRDPQPHLMHPQLGPDLLLAVGFYGGMALGWAILLKRWRFSVREAFFTVGAWGLAIEQQGRALIALIAALPSAPLQAGLLMIQVFIVYGSIGGIAHLVASSAEPGDEGKSLAWLKYPVALVSLTFGAYLGTGAVGLIANAFGGLPSRGPIWERPLW